MNDPLDDLFPDGDFRFHLKLRRSEPREFFTPRDDSGALLAERTRWLATEPSRYAALLPEGGPICDEFRALTTNWGLTAALEREISSTEETMLQLGRELEPDVLLLSPDGDGRFRLRGGALCFPTGWSLEEKLGHTMDFIHRVVPGLNSNLGGPIHQFLSRIKPGVAFLRDNWGIVATEELNLHPARAIAPPRPPADLEKLWLRVEHQALVGLPESGGVVFGIRIALHRLDAVARSSASPRLREALTTMPDELVSYKRIERVKKELIELL